MQWDASAMKGEDMVYISMQNGTRKTMKNRIAPLCIIIIVFFRGGM